MSTQKSLRSRENKVNFLKETIEDFFKKKPTGKLDVEKLSAQFALRFQSTMRTGQEIIHMLVKTGACKYDGEFDEVLVK